MESNLVTLDGSKMFGDAANRDLGGINYGNNFQRKYVGFAMGNSLSHWKDLTASATNANWEKTEAKDSGIINNGVVDIWGGTIDKPVTGLLVNFGTLKNGESASKTGLTRVDHGYALVATDGSTIDNSEGSSIIVTGKYDPANKGISRPSDSVPGGKNYGIIGISDTDEID